MTAQAENEPDAPREPTGAELFFAPGTELPIDILHVKSRREKVVEKALSVFGIPHYLPLYRKKKRYLKGTAVHCLPLFVGYIFCRRNDRRVEDLFNFSRHVAGVIRVAQFDQGPLLEQLLAIRRILDTKATVQPYEHLVPGRLVRVKRGQLKGLQGVIVRQKSACMFVVNVRILGRSASAEMDPVDLVAEG